MFFKRLRFFFVIPTAVHGSFKNGNSVNDRLGDITLEVTNDDTRFPSLTSGFNQRWYARNCEVVYQVHNPEDVVLAVNDIVNNRGGNVKIRSGGHCYENFVMNNATRGIIDVRGLTEWGKDPKRGYYLSSGESNWGAFKKLFTQWGKILPSGSCYSVGLGGHISGGGYGVMSRLYGTTVDTLTGVEVVVKNSTSSAYIKYVSEESSGRDADLFWALRGAGNGNFGVITKYYYKSLPNAPKGVIFSNIAFKWGPNFTARTLKKILDWYVNFAKRNDNRASFALFPISHRAAKESQMLIQTAYFDEKERRMAKLYHRLIEKRLKKLYDTTEPSVILHGHSGYWSRPIPSLVKTTEDEALSDKTHDLPFYDATQTINSSGPNLRGKYKSAYMKVKFPLHQVKEMIKHLQIIPEGLEEADMIRSLVQIDSYGGAINDHASKFTAMAQRDSAVKLQFQTYWVDEKKDHLHLKWIRDFYHRGVYGKPRYPGYPDPEIIHNKRKMFQGCYYNYPDIDLNYYTGKGREGALSLYFLDNFEQNTRNLVDVKCCWDPENHFKFAQSIPVKADCNCEKS